MDFILRIKICEIHFFPLRKSCNNYFQNFSALFNILQNSYHKNIFVNFSLRKFKTNTAIRNEYKKSILKLIKKNVTFKYDFLLIDDRLKENNKTTGHCKSIDVLPH